MRDDVAIRVEGLGKSYRLGHTVDLGRTFRETLYSLPRHMGRLMRRGRRGGGSSDVFWALRDLNFEIKRGEVVGVIGRNGAGKSTLLKILSRITNPTEGMAEIRGRLSSLLEVGTGFHPELTGRENVYLNGAILGMRKAEIQAKFNEIVAFAEVDKFLDTPVKRYSSGMRVRLAFAVAAHLDPECLLVDEVLAVGDYAFQQKCLGKMDDVAKGGRTVIFVSHNMAAVQRLCHRAILLRGGRTAMEGATRDVVAGYIESGQRVVGERIWDTPQEAPGDKAVRLRAVRALDSKDCVTNQFSTRDPVTIEIEFWVLEPGHTLDAGFYIYDSSGEILFVTGDFQGDRWRGQRRPVGLHRSRCHIPGDLFNDGTFSVMAYVVTNPRTLHVQERDAIQVQIVDHFEEGGARGNYTREWPGGAVRPLLEWTYHHEPL